MTQVSSVSVCELQRLVPSSRLLYAPAEPPHQNPSSWNKKHNYQNGTYVSSRNLSQTGYGSNRGNLPTTVFTRFPNDVFLLPDFRSFPTRTACGVRRIGQVARDSSALMRKCAWPALSGKESADKNEVLSERAGTTKTAHETWERWKWDAETLHAHCKHLGPCVCAMSVRHANVSEKCACDMEVFTHPVAHTVVATAWARNPELTKKNPQTSSSHFHLDFSHQDVVQQFAFHRPSLMNASRFPETCASPDFWWCHCES